MEFKNLTGSTTYWSTLSIDLLGLVLHPVIAELCFSHFAPGKDDVVWLEKHPKLKCGVGIVCHQSNTKEFKILVCRTKDLEILQTMHTTYGKIITGYNTVTTAMETNAALYQETVKIIANRISTYICLGSVKGTSTEGNKKGQLSVGQFMDAIFPNQFAPFRLKGPVPDMPGGGTPHLANVVLELESRYMKDNQKPKTTSSDDIDSWNNIKKQEEATKIDSIWSNTAMRLAQHFGRNK